MIELLEGAPGSGKTHHMIQERLIPWVTAGRRIYVYCRGIYLDRFAAFLGTPEAELQARITCWPWGDETPVRALYETVEPESVVLIDEAQTIFRSQSKLDPKLARFLETHRHHGIDVLMTCQDYRQLTSSVTRLVEVTIKFVRLSFLGLGNRYQGRVRGNPEDTEVIRKFTGTYDPKVFPFYESYAGKVKEQRLDRHTVWQSPKMLLAGVATVFAAVVFYIQPFGSLHSDAKSADIRPATPAKPAPRAASTMAPVQDLRVESPSRPVRIVVQGGMSPVKAGEPWLYVLEDGAMLSAAELSAVYGIPVVEKTVRGVNRLEGPGIEYAHEQRHD